MIRNKNLVFTLLAVLGAVATGYSAPLKVANSSVMVFYDPVPGVFSIQPKSEPIPLISNGKFSGAGGVAKVIKVSNKVFGGGDGIEVKFSNGSWNRIEVYPGLQFVCFRSSVHNDTGTTQVLKQVQSLTANIDLGIPVADVNTLGTGGLLPPDRNPGSYAFLTVVNPKTRGGVVAGWLTHDRGSGVVFSPVKNGKVAVDARIDYGCLRINPNTDADTETFMLGYFDDARLGLEAYAKAVAETYSVKLPPKQPGYCTWYMEKYAGACDEKHLAVLSEYAAKNLAPFGFGFVQIDDGWQDGIRANGPKKNFTVHAPDGPYPSGMKSTADTIKRLGLTPGIWFMPFAGTYQDPFFKDHQDWFAKTLDGKPYETAWGGTCLDLTNPTTRDYVRGVISRIGHDWGYLLFKMDGFWTGSATKQIYVNDGYKDDGIGDAIFADKDKTNIEALRSGVKLVREAAGPNVFLLGCCVSQNMRSFGGSFGLLDAMRVGPDTGSATIGYPHASRLWFLNGRVWWNDPDCVSVRASVSLDQARLNATFAAIADTVFYNSDWMPDFPAERLDVLRRCMPGHGLPSRPVDVFESSAARIWHIADTRNATRRDIVALFNYQNIATNIAYSMEKIGLPKAGKYVGFDFWANRFVPPFAETLSADLPGQACRVLAIRSVADYPQLISTSRHITQGIVDVTDEKWDTAGARLSAISKVVANDPYELRIVVPEGEKSWQAKAISLSQKDREAGVKTVFAQDGTKLRATLTSPVSRDVQWTVQFAPGSVKSPAPKPVTDIKANVEYHQITISWADDKAADLYRVTSGNGKVFTTPSPEFVVTQFTRTEPVVYKVEAISGESVSVPAMVQAQPMAKLVPPPMPPKPAFPLSDLKLDLKKNGHGPAKVNQTYAGKPLILGKTKYEKGLSLYAPAEVRCPIPSGMKRFVAVVGADASTERDRGHTKFICEVYGDVKEMGEAPVLLAQSPMLSYNTVLEWSFNIELNPRYKEVRLVVNPCGEKTGDVADWVNAGFLE